MKTIEVIERLKKATELIKAHRTGNAASFGKKLGISRRQVYKLLEDLKDFGAEISYCKIEKSFFFKNNKDLVIEFRIRLLDKDEMNDINGGSTPSAITSKQRIKFILESAFFMHNPRIYL